MMTDIEIAQACKKEKITDIAKKVDIPDEYCKAHDRVYEMYNNKHEWAKKCLINIAKSSYFSSDRTIEEYAKEIWHINKIRTN